MRDKETKTRCMNYAGQSLERPQEEVSLIDDVTQADHLICRRHKLYDHHVIVSEVDYKENTLKLTGFDGPFPEEGGKAKVVENEIQFSDLKGSLYKVVYGRKEGLKRGEVLREAEKIKNWFEQIGDVLTRAKDIHIKLEGIGCNMTLVTRKALKQGDVPKWLQEIQKDWETLKRGNVLTDVAKIQEEFEKMKPYGGYNIIINNCEHFAYHCKLGHQKSVQVGNLARTVGGLSGHAMKDLVRSCLLDKNGKVIPKNLKIGGVVASGVIETMLSAEDIYRFYKMWDEERIDEDEFYELVAKRLIVAISSIAGAELGAIAGLTFFGPLGMVVGGILGNILGKFGGRLAGEAAFYAGIKMEEYSRLGLEAVRMMVTQYGRQRHLHPE